MFLVVVTVADVAEDGSTRCSYQTMNQTIPAGRTNVTYFKPLGTVVSNEECVQRCCADDKYQYAWFVDGKCFGVGCSDENEELCSPMSVKFSMMSNYMILDRNTGMWL